MKKLYPALTVRQAQAYHMHEVEINPKTGEIYTHREIAKEMGIVKKTSENTLNNARKRLQDMKTTLENAGDRLY